MHEQIEQENREALERFQNTPAREISGLVYRDNNMDKTFQKGDRLFIIQHKYAQAGKIIVVELEPNEYRVCRIYRTGDKITLADDANPPVILDEEPVVIGEVIGFERFFV